MSGAIRSLLVANRGEIAIRIMRSAREMGIRTLAVYSEADRTAAHVRAADTAVLVGPAPSAASYLNMGAILDAARRTGADAIHPGYGFLSENSVFARKVLEAGLIFVGPTPEAIQAMGDKTGARTLMRGAGIPVVPGTDGQVSANDAAAFCASHGFPVLLKACGGGGGKGMRLVGGPGDLPDAFRAASSEASSAFGDARLYVEKYVERPRHVEIQVLADRYGNVVHLGERECSIQRRHQKVVEESPSPALTAGLRQAMAETAVRAARACSYMNAGTVEFLLDASGRFYFLEMNTRLQVEHPITELRTGLDLVALQIRIAQGEELPFTQEGIHWRGHAIECRICAEDVTEGYTPSTGRIVHRRPPQGPGVREDCGVEPGDEVPVWYDPLLSKLCIWAPSRDEAIDRMARALDEYELLGVRTNIPLLRFVMRNSAFRSGRYSTHFLDEEFSAGALDGGSAGLQRAAAAVCALLEDRNHPSIPAARGGSTGPSRGGWKKRRDESYR
jgi:acetyl-CoA carboxylase biotin carboxylase subunit